MKRKINKIMDILILATLMLMSSSVFVAVCEDTHAGDSMWIEPSTIDLSTDTVSEGYKFNVTVWINLTVTSASWEFKLIYNKNHLNASRCGYTGGSKSDFFSDITTLPLEPTFATYNGTHDYVLHAESWMMGDYRIPGYGNLSWVEFEVMAVPPEGETYTSKLELVEVYPDGTETYAQDASQNKIPLNVYQSTYVIPEFSNFLLAALAMSLALIAVLGRKLRSCLSCR